MANEETSGGSIFLTILAIIGVVAVIIGVATPNGWLRKWWRSIYPQKADGTPCNISAGQGAVAVAGTYKNGVCIANTSAEGSACTTSGNRAGTIQNGTCVANVIAPTYNATVSNAAGANVYNLSQTNTTPRVYLFMKTTTLIPAGTNVGAIIETSQAYIGNANYVRTVSGWLLASDLNIGASRISY